MDSIIIKLNALKEDKPNIVITDDIIKQYILDNIEELIKEIKEI